jgi:heat shock protein HslJ/uncharacterized lipoprotein YbaY
MKKLIVLVMIFVAGLLVACDVTVNLTPAEEATGADSAAEVDSASAETSTAPAPTLEEQLVGPIWQWVDLVETNPASQSIVADPQNYTLQLMEDGTASLKADCNQVQWTYTLEGNQLSFDAFGPSTLAMCPPESLDQQYMGLLASTATAAVNNGRLELTLANDAGTMGFQTEAAPPEPEPEVEEASEVPGIVGATWQWQAFEDSAEESDVTVATPENYTLTLLADGTASITADCNQVSWTYTLDGNSLTFNTVGPSTLAFCGEESLDQLYLQLLGTTATYVESDGNLILNLAADVGNMVFGKAEADTELQAAIVGPTWHWVQFQDSAETNDIIVTAPQNYSLTLQPDGTASIKADCNQVSWTYTLDGSSLTFNTVGASTLAFCGEESLDQQYLQLLGATATYVEEQGILYLNLAADAGNMLFGRQASATTVTGVVDAADGAQLPDNANIEVRIVSEPVGDGLTQLLGITNLQSAGTQFPIAYEVGYNSADVDPNATYTISARVTEGVGDLLYVSDTQTPVITNNAPVSDVVISVVSIDEQGVEATVTGTIETAEPLPLPEGATVQVQVQDTSRADAPAIVIGQTDIDGSGLDFPIPFEVSYNSAEIDERLTYTMSVRINDANGNLIYINDTVSPAIADGVPIESIIVQVIPV